MLKALEHRCVVCIVCMSSTILAIIVSVNYRFKVLVVTLRITVFIKNLLTFGRLISTHQFTLNLVYSEPSRVDVLLDVFLYNSLFVRHTLVLIVLFETRVKSFKR